VRRTIFTDEHEQFRQTVRAFLEKECVPHTQEWLDAGVVSREAWHQAGELGLLGWMVPEEYGGLGIRDIRYSVVIAEEIAATGTQGLALLRRRPAAGRHRHVRTRRRLRPQAGQVDRPARR
jgi:alkylation response protein AidB-like acyl-CoA dehydrogenase